MRVATYVRVGRLDGREASNLQRRQLRLDSYLSTRPRFEIAGAYHDVGRGDAGRPGLNRLLRDAAQRRFDILPIEDLDQLALGPRRLRQIRRYLQGRGVELQALRPSSQRAALGAALDIAFIDAIWPFR